MYIAYLLSEPSYTSCVRLSTIMGNLSHDSINRFLEREDYTPQDLFNSVKDELNLEGGVLSIDDSVLDKPYSDPKKAILIEYFWSGKHKRTVKGINLITLYYTDDEERCMPVNYRIYDKREGKTKNDYFREMLLEGLAWGIRPNWVTGDAWYASLENLKFLRKQKLNFLFGIDNNRLISQEKGSYCQVQTLEDWPATGRTVYLKEYGNVKVFRQEYKKVYRYYIMGVAELDRLDGLQESDFLQTHAKHWNIERFHRAIKQVCNIERFQVRNYQSMMNHFFCAMSAFVQLELLRLKRVIENWYQIQRELFVEIIQRFILHREDNIFSITNYSTSVNA
jgi:Transposase DDE domain